MTFSAKQNQTQFYTQLGFLIAVLVIVLIIFNALGVFRPATPNVHSVTYKIEGSASTVTISYITDDGTAIKPFDERPPWHKTVKFKEATTVILTATNPSGTGNMTCMIALDGKDWKRNEAKYPQDKVSCAGITP
jgi:hypothetical protein